MKKDKRSTVISTLFRSSRQVKLCKRKNQLKITVVNFVGLLAWTPYNLLMIQKEFPSQFFFLFFFCLLERNEEQDLRGTYLPDVVLNVDVVY